MTLILDCWHQLAPPIYGPIATKGGTMRVQLCILIFQSPQDEVMEFYDAFTLLAKMFDDSQQKVCNQSNLLPSPPLFFSPSL